MMLMSIIVRSFHRHRGRKIFGILLLSSTILLLYCSRTLYLTASTSDENFSSVSYSRHQLNATDVNNTLTLSTTATLPRRVGKPLQLANSTTNVTDEKYITFWGKFETGCGLGNQMFMIAAAVYVAELTGRRFVMERVPFVQGVDQTFVLNSIKRIDNLLLQWCPCSIFYEHHSLTYDSRIEKIEEQSNKSASSRLLYVQGFFQSWKYLRLIEPTLREYYFQFKPEIKQFAKKFLDSSRPSGWPRRGYVRVAIHVRRGDILLQQHLAEYGYTVPDWDYFQRAMNYFVTRYGRTQFIAISEDMKWTQENVVYNYNYIDNVLNKGIKYENRTEFLHKINVTYSFNHTAGQDMAIMAACDHVIMSTGTFGWWGAWLAKGEAVYYKDWPRNGSKLHMIFKSNDFFPPSWAAM